MNLSITSFAKILSAFFCALQHQLGQREAVKATMSRALILLLLMQPMLLNAAPLVRGVEASAKQGVAKLRSWMPKTTELKASETAKPALEKAIGIDEWIEQSKSTSAIPATSPELLSPVNELSNFASPFDNFSLMRGSQAGAAFPALTATAPPPISFAALSCSSIYATDYGKTPVYLVSTTTAALTAAATLPLGAGFGVSVLPGATPTLYSDDSTLNHLQSTNGTTSTNLTSGLFTSPYGGGLGTDTSNRLFYFGRTGTIQYLMRFNTTTTAAVNVGATTPLITGDTAWANLSPGDMMSDANGRLYYFGVDASTAVAGSFDNYLYYVDASQVAHRLGKYNSSQAGIGVAFDPSGVIYTLNRNLLYKINMTNGFTSTLIGDTGNSNLIDLASCAFPTMNPLVAAVKTVSDITTAQTPATSVNTSDTLEYTTTITNSGNLPSDSTKFVDTIPVGTSYVTGSTKLCNSTGATCVAVADVASAAPFLGTGMSVNTSGQAAGIVFAGATNAAVVKFRVTVTSTGTPSTIQNTGQIKWPTVSGGVPTINTTNTSATSVPLNLPSVSGYKSIKLTTDADSSGSITAGDTVTYTLQYVNTGTANTTSFQINDVLPTGLVSATGAQTVTVSGAGTVATKNTTYTGAASGAVSNLLAASATLAVGGVITVNIPVTISSGVIGTKSNQASATGNGLSAAVLSDNAGTTAELPATVTAAPYNLTIPISSVAQTITATTDPTIITILGVNLSLAKTNPISFTTGVAADYTLTVSNAVGSPKSGASIVIKDKLPPNIAYNSAAAGTGATGASCTSAGTLAAGLDLVCTVTTAAGIAGGGSANFTINVTPQAAAEAVAGMNKAAVDPAGGTPVSPSTCTATGSPAGCAIAPSITPIPILSITGTVFQDTASNLLVDGSIGDTNNPALSAYTVRLFDSAGTQVSITTTNVSGGYTFNGVSPTSTYYVVVDAPTSGIITEQTYAAPGAGNGGTAGGTSGYGPLCVIGGGTSGSPTYVQLGATTTTNSAATNANGYCFGGQHGAIADSGTTTLNTREHVTRVITASSNITAVDFGFSPFVVTNVNDAAQGSIRQFGLNYSLSPAGGTYNMRFVPALDTNASGVGGNWWEANLLTADASDNVITAVLNRVVNFDGTAHSNTDGTSVLDTIPGNMVSASTTVGNLGRTVGVIPRPEFAINYTGPVTVNTVILSFRTASAGSSAQDLALYETNNGNSYVSSNGGSFTLFQTVAGAKPDGTTSTGKPATAFLTNPIAWNGAINVTQNYFGKATNGIEMRNRAPGVANGYLISGNYLSGPTGSGILLEGDTATVIGNYVTGSTRGIFDGIIVGTQSTLNTITENTATANGTNIHLQGPSETVTNNVITNSTSLAGIRINTSNSIKVSQNTFGGNTGNAIDLNSNGVTIATATGADCPSSGIANGGIPRPGVTSAVLTGTTLTLTGAYCNSGTYTLEFYKSVGGTGDTGSDTLVAGEGVQYLGALTGLTGGAFTNQTLSLSAGALAAGDKVSAIAIRTDGTLGATLGSTSEFSVEMIVSLLDSVAGYKSVKLTTDADSSGSITAGDTLTWTIQYVNTGIVDVPSFQIADQLPSGITITAPGAQTVTITGSGTSATKDSTYTGAALATSMVLASGATLAKQETITVTIPVTVNAGFTGTLSNQAAASGSGITSAVSTDNAGSTADLPSTVTAAPYSLTVSASSVTQTITASVDHTVATVVAAPTVAAYKSVKLTTDADSSTSVTPGDTLTYTIFYKNTGTLDVTGFKINDVLPIGVTITGAGNETLTVTGSTVASKNPSYTGALAGTVSELLSATITFKAGDILQLDIPVTVNSGATGTLLNQALSTAANLPVARIPTDNVDSVTAGLPPGITVPSGSLTQTQNPTNDPTSITVATNPTVIAFKSVKLTTDVNSNSQPDPGDTLIWSVWYKNTGTVDVTTLQIHDVLPVGVTITGAGNQTVTVTGTTTATKNTTYTGAAAGAVAEFLSATTTFKAGDLIQIDIPVTVNPGFAGSLLNQATGTGGNLPPAGVITDNADSSSTGLPSGVTIPTGSAVQTLTPALDPTSLSVAGIPAMSLVKSVTPTGDQQPGTDLTYQIVFTNTGNGGAQEVVIFDPIPTETDFKLGSATTTLGTTGLTMVIEYSNDFVVATPATATWTYVPITSGGGADTGYDRNVKAVRWRVSAGTLSQTSPNHTGDVGFTVKIR